MSIQEEQERRRDLLLRALDACPDPEQALIVAVRMEKFITDGQTSPEQPHESTQPDGQLSSESSGKKCNRSRWTGADDTHLHQLWQGNLTVEEIAQELERTPASIYARVRILDLSSNLDESNNGKRKKKRTSPGAHSLTAHSEKINLFEAVGIDSVVHFLRTRDYSVVQTKNDCYDLDGRKVLTAQELFDRANGVRAQLGRPTWAALENWPRIEAAQKSKN